MIHFAACYHLPHQGQGFVGDAEPPRRVTRGEPSDAQHAYRVFGESGRNVSQHSCGEIALAAERVDDRAMLVLGHRVDGEIATLQILRQCHRWISMKRERVITAPGLALGSRQRVFLAGLRVQEDREILADRAIAEHTHLFRRRTNHHEIAISDANPE